LPTGRTRYSDLDIAVVIDAEDAVITEIADMIRDRLREAGDELGFAPRPARNRHASIRFAAKPPDFYDRSQNDTALEAGP
jgi:predicted nucleotidyltransferase